MHCGTGARETPRGRLPAGESESREGRAAGGLGWNGAPGSSWRGPSGSGPVSPEYQHGEEHQTDQAHEDDHVGAEGEFRDIPGLGHGATIPQPTCRIRRLTKSANVPGISRAFLGRLQEGSSQVKNLKRILIELALGLLLVGIGLVDIRRGECGIRFGSFSSGWISEWSIRQADSPAVFSSCLWYTFGGAAVCFVFCFLDGVFAVFGGDDS